MVIRTTPAASVIPVLAVAFMTLLPGGSALAQRAGVDDDEVSEYHTNHLGVFVGETRQFRDGKLAGVTLGLDYERRFGVLGILGRADFLVGDHERAVLLNVDLAYHPGGNWRLAFGPGFETVEEDEPSGQTAKKLHFVLALGVDYSIEIGDWSVSPTAWFDFIGKTKTNVAYGITVGRGF